MAYVEFLACMEEINSLLDQGFSKRMVHERLTEKGNISMAYVTFCQVMQKKAKDSINNNAKPNAPSITAPSSITASAAQSSPHSGPRIVNSSHETFPDPRKMSLEDGI